MNIRKLKILITLIAVITLVACERQSKVCELMDLAENIVSANPDSSFYILDSLRSSTTGLSEHTMMKLDLLRAQAMNKSFRMMDTLTVLENVVKYYKKNGDDDERMMSKYMLGCMYRDRKNYPLALRCYREAVAFADTTDKDCNYYELCRIYAQMASLFNEKNSPALGLKAWDDAIKYAWKAKDTLSVINYMSHKCSSLIIQSKLDSTMIVSQAAYNLAVKLGRMDEAAQTLPFKIYVFLERGQYYEALRTIKEFEKNAGIYNKSGNIKSGRELFYAEKGRCYEGLGAIDSALVLYQKTLEYPQSTNSYEAGYRGLMSVYSKLGKVDSVSKYAKLYAVSNDSNWVKNTSNELNRMQILYNFDDSRRHALQKEKEKAMYQKSLVIGFLLGLLLLSIALLYIHRQRKQNKMRMIMAYREYSDILSKYTKLEKDIKLMREDSKKYMQEREEELNALQNKLAVYGKDSHPGNWDMAQALFENDVVKRIHDMAAKAKPLSDSELTDLIALVSVSMPKFMQRIDNPDHGLSDKEKLVAILMKLHLQPSEISVLLDITKQRVSNIRSAINKKLFNQEGTKTLDSNIRTIN